MDIALFIGAAVVLMLHANYLGELFEGNACDDAYISFRYLQNLLDGHGLVYNPGERAEGYSNFAWILVLAPFGALGFDIPAVARLLGALLGLVTLGVALFAMRRVLGVRGVLPGVLLVGLCAVSGYFAFWLVSGMETGLWSLALVGAWARYEHERRYGGLPIAGILVGLLPAIRPEGLLLAGVALAYHAVEAARGRLRPGELRRFAIGMAAPVLVFEAFRLSYYGWHLWPTSVRAKVGLTPAQIERGLAFVADEMLVPYAFLLVPLLGLARCSAPLQRAAVLLGSLVAFVALSGGDWSHGRLFAPLVPLGAMVLAGWLGEHAPLRHSYAVATVAMIAALFVHSFRETSYKREREFARMFASWDSGRVALGHWIADNTPEDTVVALYAAGAIAYYSGRRAHDMLGLNDLHIASLEPASFGEGRAGHEKFDVDYTLEDIRPDILVDPGLVPGMTDHPLFRERYVPLPGFGGAFVTRELQARIATSR